MQQILNTVLLTSQESNNFLIDVGKALKMRH